MKEDIKAKWLTALRDGSYTQGKFTLEEGGNFCCLGVLCDLHSKESGGEWLNRNAFPERKATYLGKADVLPVEVMEWAGLNHQDPQVNFEENSELYDTVSMLNDSGKTFSEIADIIEKDL